MILEVELVELSNIIGRSVYLARLQISNLMNYFWRNDHTPIISHQIRPRKQRSE